MATIRQSILSTLQAASSVTALLSNGASGIVEAGRITPTFPAGEYFIGLRMGDTSGSIRTRPFADVLAEVWACHRANARGIVDWDRIDDILKACRTTLDAANITATDDGLFVFQFVHDNYRGRDWFDTIQQFRYRSDRYRANCAWTTHHHP